MAEKKWHISRKFIAFILCLIALIVLGIFDKDTNSTAIITLFGLYVTGNVAQKATAKEVAHDVE